MKAALAAPWFVVLCDCALAAPTPTTAPGVNAASGCGQIAVYITTKYLGGSTNAEPSVGMCRNPEACTVEEVCELVRGAGYGAYATRLRLTDITSLPLPAIMWIPSNQSEYGHFIAVRGMGNDAIVQADVVEGARRVNVRDLPEQTLRSRYPVVLVGKSQHEADAVGRILERASVWDNVEATGVLAGAAVFSIGVIRRARRRTVSSEQSAQPAR